MRAPIRFGGRKFLLAAVFAAVGMARQKALLGQEQAPPPPRTLEAWTFEPVALDGAGFRFLLDRHDGSFVLEDLQSSVRFFSAARRRGLGTLLLEDGRELPLDRVIDVFAAGERIHAKMSSSRERDLRLEVEIRLEHGRSVLVFEAEPPADFRAAGLRFPDGAFWVTDAGGGGMIIPEGEGRFVRPRDLQREPIRLSAAVSLVPQEASAPLGGGQEGGPPSEKRPFRGESAGPASAYTMLAAVVLRDGSRLLVYWEDPLASLRLTREPLPQNIGARGEVAAGLGLEFRSLPAEWRLAPAGPERLGFGEVAELYRRLTQERTMVTSLRYKTAGLPGAKEDLRALIGAPVFRFGAAAPPEPPHRFGRCRFSFEELAGFARRIHERLELDAALILVEDWLGTPAGAAGPYLDAAAECGGREALAGAFREIRALGYVPGLAISREALIPFWKRNDLPRNGEAAWAAILEGIGEPEGLKPLAAALEPALVVLRGREGVLPAASTEAQEILALRGEVEKRLVDLFGAVGVSPGGEWDLARASYVEGVFERWVEDPTDQEAFPLLPAIHGAAARFAVGPGGELGAASADRGFLALLLLGEVPSFKAPLESRGDGSGPSAGGLYARGDGWAEGRGLQPLEIFIKNACEAASPLARLRAREALFSFRRLGKDGKVLEVRYGPDLRIAANFGEEPFEDAESECLLPRHGFVIRHPFFYAFCALRAQGLEYPEPAFFTVRSLGSKMYLRSERTRIYHGFGPPAIRVGGRTYTVEREVVLKLE